MKTKSYTVIIFLIGCLFFACTNAETSELKITYKSKIFTEQFLIAYLNENKDLHSKDSLKFANALDKFQRDIKGLSNNPDFLVDFPLQATNIRDTVMGAQSFKIVTFESFTDISRDKESILNRIKLRVNGIFQFENEAFGLDLGGKYYLKALIYKQGKRADVHYYKKADGAIYNLGVYPMQVKELKPVVAKTEMASLK